ncbi:MAG: hypothetical protein H7288_04590, partial [Kineosporiaceae bacterium]|nr:hypothetical protein [Aeromicrobium sp.]
MTRGRENNTAHLVADDLNDARHQWILTFARNRADLGPAHAARLAAEEAAKYEPYVSPENLRSRHQAETKPHPTPAPEWTPSRDPNSRPSIGR